MKIRMLTTERGARDGIHVETFDAGAEYDLSATERARELATAFVREGWAVAVGAPIAPQPECAVVAEAREQIAPPRARPVEQPPSSRKRRH